MSVPPPGMEPNPFFGAPLQPPPPPPAQYGYAPPVYGIPAPAAPGGYAPPGYASSGFTPPRAAESSASGRPELVTVACTLLAVFAAVGVFTIIAALLLGSDSSGSDSGDGSSSVSGVGVGLIYAVLWGGSGFINAGLVVYLRRGDATARMVTTVICGLWTLFWLKELYQLSNVGDGDGNILVLGDVVHLGELLLVGLAIASALPAVLVWRPSASRHFS